MITKQHRLDQIVKAVDEQGYISVKDLSSLLAVSEMTIRRDLEQLDEENRIKRTYGGATSCKENNALSEPSLAQRPGVLLVDTVDVLIATSVNPYYDKLLLDRLVRKNIPVIAESLELANQRTVVSVNNYQAAFDLGRATGQYLMENGFEKANLLDLTFILSNTQKRSRGYLEGLSETCPATEVILSINAQSRAATAYRITYDALVVHPNINVIFAINDSTAQGALHACKELKIPSEKMVVVTFGLEGDTLRDELMANSYCKIGLAMFPEIVALACIDSAIGAYAGNPLPEEYITPHVVLTSQTLPDYYYKSNQGWQLNWEVVRQRLPLPARLKGDLSLSSVKAPLRVGLTVPFLEHEWYKELTNYLEMNANQCGASLVIIDAEQSVQDEVELRRRAIARKAASLVEADDVILVDGGPIARYLAEELRGKNNATVITNSMEVLDVLNPSPGITLISTGGAVRFSSQMMVGPTAETALKELRADKLFLSAGGISLDFGLSHTNISEVTMKQAMIHSARQVILTADHTSFTTELIIQVAPLSVVDMLITDDALPPSTRLNLTKMGIRLILA